jgi:hypothetical protein
MDVTFPTYIASTHGCYIPTYMDVNSVVTSIDAEPNTGDYQLQ